MRIATAIPVVFLTVLLATHCFAEGDAPAAADASKTKVTPRVAVTHHKIEIAKEILNYTAIAGETILQDPDGTQEAAIFSISYIKEGDNSANRPITFLFNGGPGSSAVWLHLGAFGPKRIAVSADPVNPGAPPYELMDNPNTLLRFSDLVFIDPIGTGYSRALGKNKDKDYWGVDEDSAVIAKFIRNYLSANQRWKSPKYLAGESYGTIRASVLIRDLEMKLLDGVFFNGVVLISSALDVRTFLNGGPANELAYVTCLPTYAATAFFHKVLPQQPDNLDAFIKKVEDFAGSEYLQALFKGNELSSAEEDSIAQKLHEYTGLSVEYLKRSHLRINQNRFVKELLRSRGQTLALHDTRYVGKDPDEAGENVALDPFLFGVTGPFVSGINGYLAGDLNLKIAEPYTVFSLEANNGWKRAGGNTGAFDGFLNTVEYLEAASATNKDFRVFVASGMHDLTTTFFGTQYVFEHSQIDKNRLTIKTYFGGHMMYLNDPSLKALSDDIGTFMKAK